MQDTLQENEGNFPPALFYPPFLKSRGALRKLKKQVDQNVIQSRRKKAKATFEKPLQAKPVRELAER